MRCCISSPSPGASACRSAWTIGTQLGRDIPTIVDLQPSGRFLMEEFYYAGGLPVVMKAWPSTDCWNGDALTRDGPNHLGERAG